MSCVLPLPYGRDCTRVWRAAAGVLLAGALPLLHAQAAAPAERDLNQPLIAASSEVFFPHQFRDTDGKLKGFANDVTDGVARVMNLKVRRVTVSNTQMADALRSGRVDFIQFWSETDERRAWAEFSVPVVGGIETIAVVRKSDRRFRTLADLDGKRVAVGQRGTVGWKYLTQVHPTATPVFTETTEQFLRALAAGEIDAAVLSRLTAASMIERFGLRSLKVLEDRIPGGEYDVRYCFTVRKGDALLLARLNEGLAILHRTGEFDRIYRTWFGRYEQRTFSPAELMRYVSAALALACLAATWGLLRQRTLRRRIARQAAELAEQRSLLAALHDKHPLATVIFELRPRGATILVSANNEAARLFTLDPALLPRALDGLALAPEPLTFLREALEHWHEVQPAEPWETRLPGTQQLLETTVVPLGSDEAGVQRVCVLANDVTRRRLMDQELAQSRRLRALGELVGGIAHEFNNLLTPIIMTTSHAQSAGTLPAEQQASFTMIDAAARRAAELTRRLLTFGRKADERAQPVQLAAVIDNSFALLRSTGDRRIEWTAQCASGLPPVWFNPTDLNQIVFNLVLNARDALHERLARARDDAWTPRVQVTAVELPPAARPAPLGPGGRRPLAWQRLTVEDNGVGIPPENIERIFEPFFTTKDVGQGTGLGLATVWHLVTEAGGEITVESCPGEGAKFHVLLPRWETAPAAGAASATAAAVPAATTGARVLLVDDEPLVAHAAAVTLQCARYRVTQCGDGAAAWSQLAENPAACDLLLADVNMPRMSGVDLVRRVRGTKFAGKIVMMTGRVAEEDRRALRELGVDGILPKPFAGPELVAAVEAALHETPAAAAHG